MELLMEYMRITSWFQLGTGLERARSLSEQGWELVSVASMTVLGSTYAYQLVFKRPASGS